MTPHYPSRPPWTTPMTPAGERLAATASRLFYDRGIRAVGVELIAEEAGTTKKTLYDRFGSKDGLVVLYLRRRAAAWQAAVPGRPRRAPPSRDRAGPRGLRRARAPGWPGRGGAAPSSTPTPRWAAPTTRRLPVIRAEKDWMRALFAALADEAGYDDPDRTGAELHLLYEGAIVALTAGDRPDAVALARDAAGRLLRG